MTRADEFHHAAAPSYQDLLDYYRPKILLGLTATPERADDEPSMRISKVELPRRSDYGKRLNENCSVPGIPSEFLIAESEDSVRDTVKRRLIIHEM